jgi:hypothetical protein
MAAWHGESGVWRKHRRQQTGGDGELARGAPRALLHFCAAAWRDRARSDGLSGVLC